MYFISTFKLCSSDSKVSVWYKIFSRFTLEHYALEHHALGATNWLWVSQAQISTSFPTLILFELVECLHSLTRDTNSLTYQPETSGITNTCIRCPFRYSHSIRTLSEISKDHVLAQRNDCSSIHNVFDVHTGSMNLIVEGKSTIHEDHIDLLQRCDLCYGPRLSFYPRPRTQHRHTSSI